MAFGRPNPRDDAREQQMRQWLQRQNGFAIASLVLGLFSLIEFGVLLVFGIGGIAAGVVALRQLKTPVGERTQGRGLALAGIVLSVLSLMIAGVLYSIRSTA